MLAIALSIAVLSAGLAIGAAQAARPKVGLGLDGFIGGAVSAIVAVHVAPQLWTRLGPASPMLLAAGYGGFWLAETVVERGALRERVIVGMLVLHSLVDGASLAAASMLRSGGALSAMIVAHRLPEGLVVGALLAPKDRVRGVGAAAALLGAATVAGGLLGGALLAAASAGPASGALACAVGALLRAVLHGHGPWRDLVAPRALGAAAGIALVLALPE